MRIKPLTHKMKNRVREHGDEWDLMIRDTNGFVEYWLISPATHRGKSEPYAVWVVEYKDIEVLN